MCDDIWAILGGIIMLHMANLEVSICEGTDRTQLTHTFVQLTIFEHPQEI